MAEERDDDSGKFVKQYPVKDFVEAVEVLDTPTTQKIAQEVGCSYDLAYRRLNALEKEGVVSHNDVGGSLLWSLSENH